MAHIAIIGAGQIGSRHLQALVHLDRPATIYLVDPSDVSLKTAENRYLAVTKDGPVMEIEPVRAIGELPEGEIDAAIVATNANVRADVVEELVSSRTVRNLILEKVLFQRTDDYRRIGRLLDKSGIPAWVNCPRRMWGSYISLRETLSGAPLREIHVSGSAWGLGCNAIHFLDLAAFFTSETSYRLSSTFLDDGFIPSKRQGHIEFTGTLSGLMGDRCRITLSSVRDGTSPRVIRLSYPDRVLVIDEANGKLWQAEDSAQWDWSESPFEAPFQSELTHLAVQNILDRGTCGLTTYYESERLHMPMLDVFLTHLNQDSNRKTETCPIT